VVPGLTLYLREAPRRELAERALAVYERVCPEERRRLVSGTRAPAFAPRAEAVGAAILETHLARMDRRRDQAVMLWDGEVEESWSFLLQGVPAEHGVERASFCHVLLPNEAGAPAALLELATQLAEELPLLSGHGGLTAVFDAEHKSAAFDQIYAWARRYPGLEVEDLNLTLATVLDGVKGASWLTLVGDELWSRLASSEAGAPALGPEVELRRTGHGVLLRAGREPTLGDRNRGLWPYVEVERALEPLKITAHPELPGRFQEEEATLPWLRRLLEPAGW